jgi:hypothetical protein
MARGMKSESSVIPHNGLLQVLHLSQLLEASGNGVGEIIESCGTVWMARGTKSKRLAMAHNSLLHVLHLSQLLKPFVKSYRQIAQQISALEIPLRTALNVLSTVRNRAVEPFLAVWRLLHTIISYHDEARFHATISPCCVKTILWRPKLERAV